jgi:hypothetical protein
MATLERIDAATLRAVVHGYRDALRAHQESINRLNVYPVPDGDTGTNMALTLESVCAELEQAEDDMAATCKAISYGSLMGARGNSGVILSGILRGVSEGMKGADAADGTAVCASFLAAKEGAYGAVGNPVEGTILTVVRGASDGAQAAADADGDLVAVLEAAKVAGAEALASTPDLLPVLKEAGVVDAGGTGFLLFVDALLHAVDGRGMPEPEEISDEAAARVLATHGSVEEAHEGGVGDLRYEVMYFLEAPDETIPWFKDVWAGIGDSIVVVGGDGIWNCHIHTDDIGASIEAALDCGRPRNIRVTDLMEQVEEERWVREAPVDEEEPAHATLAVPTAVVAVATGDGIRRIFHSLGVQKVVVGGQTMNPSTADLLAAVEAAPADEVVILPNNKNIVPVARQVDEQTSKTVRVVPTRGVTDGFASLVAYDPQATADENVAAMGEAAEHTVSGEVTQAVRDSVCDLGPIKEGDHLGVSNDGILAVAPELVDAAVGLLDVLITDDHEIVTIIEGEGATAGATRHLTEWLAEHRPDVAPEVHHGGQPLYPYYFGVE